MLGLLGLSPEKESYTGENDFGGASTRVLAMNQESVDSVYFNNNLRVSIITGKHLLGRKYRGNYIAKHHIFVCYEQMCSILAQCVDYYDVKNITKFSDLPPSTEECINVQTFDSEQVGTYISLSDFLSTLLGDSSTYNFKDTKTALSLAQQLISTASTFYSEIEAESAASSPTSSDSKLFLSKKQSPHNNSVVYYKSKEFTRLQENKNEEAYRVMRCLIPVDISVTSIAKLRESELPDSVCDRIFKMKALWLICMHKDDIQKIHIADLVSKYVYHGLDLVEMRAIAYNLPLFDDKSVDIRKKEWRTRFDEKLYDMIGRDMNGTLHDYEIRNFAYSSLLTLRHDYFSPSAPLRRQTFVKSDVSSNSIRNDESNNSFSLGSKDPASRHLRLEHWTEEDSDTDSYSDVQSHGGSERSGIDAQAAIDALEKENLDGYAYNSSSALDVSSQRYVSGVRNRAYEVSLDKRKTVKSPHACPMVDKSSIVGVQEVNEEEDQWNELFNLSLETVVEEGDVRGLRQLVRMQKIEMTPMLASQLLLQASQAGGRVALQHVELAAYLVDKCGADVAYCDTESLCTSLHYAAAKPMFGKMLLSRGANFLSKNRQDQSPLDVTLAEVGGECWMLPALEARPDVVTRLGCADKKEFFLFLLRKGWGGYAVVFCDEGCFSAENPLVSSDEAMAIMESFRGDFSGAPQPIETFELLEKLILS